MAEAVTKLSIALVGWQIIPAVASNIIARIVVSLTGKQLTARERHYIIISGLFAYLLVNFITALTGVEASFYELLHVPPDADENAIRLAFRAFARKNHPDRVGASGADMFMAVRHGYESLMDPNKRWAYDRFGTGIMRCTQCHSQLDFLHEGLIRSAGFHLTTLSVILGSTLLGGRSWTTLWRLLLSLFTMFAELVLIFHPSPGQATIYDTPPLVMKILAFILPNRVPFQYIHFLHHLSLFVSLAMSRVLAALFPRTPQDTDGTLSQRAVQDLAIRIAKLERQTSLHIHDELSAIMPPDMDSAQKQASFAQLTRGMERLVLEKRLTTGEDSPIGAHVPRSPPRPGPSRTTSFAATKNPVLTRQVSSLRIASSSTRPLPQRRTSMATGAQVAAPSTPGSRPSTRRQPSGLTRGEPIEIDSTDASESSVRWSDSGIGEDTVAGDSYVVVDEPDAGRALRSDMSDGRHELMLLPTERNGREETPLMPGMYRRGRSKSW